MEEPIIALATANGVGAISVLRLSGKDCIQIVNDVFRGKDLTVQATHTAHFGYIEDKKQERTLDEVLVTIFKNPNSYTKEDSVEISCHGSPYIVKEVIKLFLSKGVRLAEPGEFTKRAFLNGRFDLAQAEAVADLIASETKLGHDLALKQLRGGVSNEIKELRERLIHFASLIELELDFSEEDVEFADRDLLVKLINEIREYLAKLIHSFEYGNAIKKGVPVAIVGKPNAGKSTLLNSLLNEEKAIVSDIPGTTRDFIEDELVIDGIPFRFIDTAGIRETQEEIEAIGVRKAKEKIEEASIVLYLFDVVTSTEEEVHAEIEALSSSKIIPVANKIDSDGANIDSFSNISNLYTISAKAGDQIELLKQALVEKVQTGDVEGNNTIISSSRHYQMLVTTNESLEAVLIGISNGLTGDFLSIDIRTALDALGEITGEISTDDLLDNIFSKFCIGK